ncbi:MAG TPA: DUF2127 domain-containing protein [Burkholderiales bacterium]|nr:DUF2127 domain-containing protein [Burkholderiales bacterium]
MIAVVEAAKGLLVIVAGFGLLALLHRDAQTLADELVRHFHLNPASRYPRIFLLLAAQVTHSEVWLLALAAAAYAAIRLVEAYGLWFDRTWANWLGALSGGIYVPIEVYEFAERRTPTGFVVLAVNVIVVAYLGYRLWRKSYRSSFASGRYND